VLFLLFPAVSLYTSFHGLEDDVRLQYSFQERIFSLLIVTSCLVFWLNSRFCAVPSGLHVSLFSDTSFSAYVLCMYVCMYVCVYRVCMYVCIVYVCMCLYMYVCIYTCMYVCVCMYVCFILFY
jgi:hypothetical protein